MGLSPETVLRDRRDERVWRASQTSIPARLFEQVGHSKRAEEFENPDWEGPRGYRNDHVETCEVMEAPM